jgi:hypothetical protein
VELVLPPDVVRWRAVDAASAHPSPEPRSSGSLGVTIRSDADGTFELRGARGSLSCPGLRAALARTRTECGDLGRPCIVELVPSATLELHLVDGSGAPAGNVHVEVEPARHLGLPVLEDAWRADVDVDGMCAFELLLASPCPGRPGTNAGSPWMARARVAGARARRARVLTRCATVSSSKASSWKPAVNHREGPIRLAPASASFAEEDLRQQEIPNVYQLLAESDLKALRVPHVPAGTWRLELPFRTSVTSRNASRRCRS